MKRKLLPLVYIFGILYLIVFIISDQITVSSGMTKILWLTVITFIIPIVYAINNINSSTTKVPAVIKYTGIFAATTFLFIQYTHLLMFSLVYIKGSETMSVIWNHRLIFFGVFIGLMALFQYIRVGSKIVQSIIVILMMTVLINIGIIFTETIMEPHMYELLNNIGIEFILELFFPILFLSFYRFKQLEFDFSFFSVTTFYIFCGLMLVLLSDLIKALKPSELYVQAYVSNLISGVNNPGFHVAIISTIVFVNFLVSSLIYIRVKEVVDRNKSYRLNNNTFKISLIIILGIMLASFSFASSFENLRQLTRDIYLLTQVALLFSIVGYSFYLGLGRYRHLANKLFLYLISSFPIVYALVFLSHLKHMYITILGNIIYNINFIFLVFSIMILIFYTIETIVLMYGYHRRIKIDDIAQMPVIHFRDMYVFIPCMNEEVVIADTLRSLLKSDYPNLHIIVIDDDSADKTAEIVKSFTDPRLKLLSRRKPNAQLGKGKALNYAFEYLKNNEDLSKDALIAIMDADTEVDHDYFYSVNYCFDQVRDLTGLQSKVRISNTIYDHAQDIEFGEIIHATQSVRNMSNTVAFGGNGQFCRLDILLELDEEPWSESLVEDFDLSTRLYIKFAKRIKNIQVDDICVYQSGINSDFSALVKQRVRWAQGNVQSVKYIPSILKQKELLKKQKFELLITLLKPWMMGIEYLIIVYTFILFIDIIVMQGATPALILILALFLLMAFYIIFINLIWSILHNRANKTLSFKHVITDTFYLCRFLFVLSQIYPQSIIKFFKKETKWDKTVRNMKT